MAKILIVDDDALMTRMYTTKFKTDGFDVDTASDGEEGIAKAQSYQPDIILLDMMMPKMNGLDALKKLKEQENTKKIPVVILSNVGDEANVNVALEHGAVTYLVKATYTPKEVVLKTKEILSGYKAAIPQVKVETKEAPKE